MNPIEHIVMERIEAIGWVATSFILYSFFLEGKKLRIWNSIGASLWVLYGIGKGLPSVIFLNGIVILIHLLKLRKG